MSYGEIRSILHAETLDFYAFKSALESLDNPDLKRVAIRSFLESLARRAGQDPTQAEFTLEIGSRWYHLELEDAVEMWLEKAPFRVTITPLLYAGMEISYRVGGDSHGRMITEIHTPTKIKVAHLDQARLMMEAGVPMEKIPGKVFTRRQRKKSGRRGWVAKGCGIEAITYSGLSFKGAFEKRDPHF